MGLELISRAVDILEENKADRIIGLDVSEQLGLTDYFLIANSQSPPHLGFLAEELTNELESAGFDQPYAREGDANGGWILVDYGEVIVHLFLPERREYYDLEGLWADAPEIEKSSLKKVKSQSSK